MPKRFLIYRTVWPRDRDSSFLGPAKNEESGHHGVRVRYMKKFFLVVGLGTIWSCSVTTDFLGSGNPNPTPKAIVHGVGLGLPNSKNSVVTEQLPLASLTTTRKRFLIYRTVRPTERDSSLPRAAVRGEESQF